MRTVIYFCETNQKQRTGFCECIEVSHNLLYIVLHSICSVRLIPAKGKPVNEKKQKRTEKSDTFTLHEHNKQVTGEVWSQKNSIATFLADPLDPERPVIVRISWQLDEMGHKWIC